MHVDDANGNRDRGARCRGFHAVGDRLCANASKSMTNILC